MGRAGASPSWAFSMLRAERWGRERMVEERDRALRRLLAHAYANVPYWRRVFDRAGVRPRDIRTATDLPALPVTTRAELHEAPVEQKVARGLDPARLIATTTSGYSGQPFTILRTRLELRMTPLPWLRTMLRGGLRLTQKRALVRGIRHEPGHEPSAIKRALNAFGLLRNVTVDCELAREEILRRLREYNPDFLGGYPGALCHVAEAVTDEDRRAIRPRAVAVGGEVLTQEMRELLGRAFGAPVYSGYGSHEFNLIAWDCGRTDEMHTCDDCVVVEVLRDGRPARPGEKGMLVGTNLCSYAMPIIRYRLDDVVTQGREQCACGQPFGTIRRVEGRVLDYFQMPDGRLLHPYEFITPVRDSTPWIYRYQFIQESVDRVVLRIVPRVEPSAEELQLTVEAAQPVFGPGVQFRVEVVADIPLRGEGKFCYARSLVTRPEQVAEHTPE